MPVLPWGRVGLSLLAVGLFTASLPGFAQPGPAGERLKALDTDGDHRISRAEAAAPRLDAFQKADANGDGELSPEEMEDFREGERAARRSARFAALDADGDGRLSQAETDARSAARFDRVDANGDGFLTTDELRQARGQRGRRGRR